jgi:hypothetical protein
MLHFEREATRSPRLVVIDGGRSQADARLSSASIRGAATVAFVVAATLLAVAVDLVDDVPAWSPVAALASAFVLAAHALLSRRR